MAWHGIFLFVRLSPSVTYSRVIGCRSSQHAGTPGNDQDEDAGGGAGSEPEEGVRPGGADGTQDQEDDEQGHVAALLALAVRVAAAPADACMQAAVAADAVHACAHVVSDAM